MQMQLWDHFKHAMTEKTSLLKRVKLLPAENMTLRKIKESPN